LQYPLGELMDPDFELGKTIELYDA
jgi:hypothetical protein